MFEIYQLLTMDASTERDRTAEVPVAPET